VTENEVAKQIVALQELEQQIVVDVDNASGQILTSRERIVSTREAVRLARLVADYWRQFPVPPPELGLDPTPRTRVSIFLSIFDVHVQRIPIDGRVTCVAYRAGAFLSADLDKASEDNERNSLVIDSTSGGQIVVTQIAGLIARRIVCDVVVGAPVLAGDTYGLIRFGSRVDTYLPAGSELVIAPGQRTIGGETVLARLATGATAASPEPTRTDPGRVDPVQSDPA